MGRFENISVYESGAFGTGAGSGGITLPGIGIAVGTGAYTQMSTHGTWNLLAHEFGHVLQSKNPIVAADGFYSIIGPESLAATTSSSHYKFWTETWANYLSHKYFSGYSWDFTDYPVQNISKFNWLRILQYRLLPPKPPIPAVYP